MIANEFRILSDRFNKCADQAVKATHLSTNLHDLSIQAGRLLIDAIDLGVFPQARKDANGVWWDRSIGRIPGGAMAVCGGDKSDKDELDPEYIAAAQGDLSARQFRRCWIYAIGSWLVPKFPARFSERAANWDWKTTAMDQSGRPIGKDRKPLRARWYKNGKPLPDDFKWKPEHGSGYQSKLEGEPADVTDLYDDADWLAHERTRIRVYADACRLLAEMTTPDTPLDSKPLMTITKSRKRAHWLAESMLLVRDHPEWSDSKVAQEVRVHRSTLTRSDNYQRAATMARGDRDTMRRGHITVDPDTQQTGVEAYDDSP